MNERKILRLFPNASRAFLEANAKVRAAEQGEQDERPLVGAPEGKETILGRPLVRFTCFRSRLLDDDNNAASIKDLLDGLRHAHCIRGDSTKEIRLEVSQEQVRYGQERTEIEIIYP